MGNTDILFRIDAIGYNGKPVKKLLIKQTNDIIDNHLTADEWLSNNMSSIMLEEDLILVNNYIVKKIGEKLKIPERKKYIRKVAPKDNPILIEPVIDYVSIAFDGRPSYENVYGNNNILKIPNREDITKQLKEVINNRKILIIENSNGLGDGIGEFYKWTIEEKIDSFCVFNSNNLPIEFLLSKVIEYELIAFQSQFVYENSLNLKQLIVNALTTPKTFIGVNLRGELKYNPSKIHTLYDLTVYEYSSSYDWELNELK